MFKDHTFVGAEQVDARFVDPLAKKVIMVKLSCLWVETEHKGTQKIDKYGPLRQELSRQNPEYMIAQLNVIVDLLGR